MKYAVITLILLGIITRPALAELNQDDLNKIRLIAKEEVKTEITASEKRMREYIDLKFENVETRFQSIDQRFDDVNKRFDDVNGKMNMLIYFLCGLIALIAIAIIPQYIFLWRSQNTAEQDRINQELREKIETLEQQRIVNP